MNRLYQDYYTESYLRARRYWEPWYTSDVNNSRADDPKDIESRRRGLSEFLKRYAPKDILAGSVLDYGGDRGQFIPLQIGDKKFVFEASHRSPTEGVVRLAARDSLQQQTFDLVLLSHVLEHIPEPHSFLRRMNEELGPKNRRYWFYVEVPAERPRILRRTLGVSRLMQRRESVGIATHRLRWIIADLYSTFFRVKFSIVPPFGVTKLHEHLNFFSKASLRTLLEQEDFGIVACEESSSSSPSSKMVGINRVFRVLAKRNS